MYGDESFENSRLMILSPDGLEYGRMENPVPFHGRLLVGRYGWFEQAMTSAPDNFGVVFQTTTHGDFRCDVDARTLRVVRVFPTR